MCGPRGKYLRKRSDKVESLPADRVGDTEPACVQHQSAGLSLLAVELSVDHISDDGAADVVHVYADLVGAPSVENAMH